MVNQEQHDETTGGNTNEGAEAEVVSTSAPDTVKTDAAAASPEVEASAEAAKKPDAEPLVLPLHELTAEERFRATTRMIFLAPDVPPVLLRPRRNEFRQLDEILDERYSTDDDDQDAQAGRRRNRRRSGRGDGNHSEEEPTRRPQQRSAPVVTEPQKVKGSTRLEAKKQRRRDGRDAGRRRTVITESEFLARRESVDREMVVRTTADRIQIGVLEDKVLVEHYVARSSESSMIGNVYLGRVQNVLPSMEAAFVDIGRGRNAVLYSGEVDWSEFEGGNAARKIENALKPGDQVLVQVTKDPVGHKGARLTSQISLPGRFLVYVPGGAMNGISRKLPDTERARLKKILKEVLPSGAGVIVRTAAEGASEEQLTHDVERLTRQWESIHARSKNDGAPTLLHSEPDMLIKIVRDVFNEDFHKLVISGDDTYATIEGYLSQVAPDLMQRVERHTAERDIFDEYRINEQIAKALDRKAWLPSGGSLVIDRTEAMTVIDVNTGKFVGSGGNLEETVTKNNLEAAEEIVRQLRLRDIGGIIVIDFIDMVLESNRDLVLRRLVECLSRDRTKHQVAEVTSLGLVQMTRKKLGLGLLESFSEACETCAGRGIIVHHEPVSKHGNGGGASRGKRKSSPPAQQSSQAHAISDGAKNMLAQVAASTIGSKPEDSDTQDVQQIQASQQAQPTTKDSSVAEAQTEQSTGVQRASAEQPVNDRAKRSRSRRVTQAPTSIDTSTEQSEVPSSTGVNSNPAVPAADPVAAPVEDAKNASSLLDSVLNALPEFPSAKKSRTRGRRVTTQQVSPPSVSERSVDTQLGEADPDDSGSSGASAAGEPAEKSEASAGPAESARIALDAALDATAKQKNT